MLIDYLSINPGPTIYYDNGFRVVLESYLTWLKVHSTTQQINISQQLAYKFEGDFFGLLASYNVPPYMHWIVMRMNDLTSPADSEADITTMLVPDNDTLDYIRQSYMSTNRING